MQVEAYFPAGIWYSLWDSSTFDARQGGSWQSLPAPLGHVPLHLRAGNVLPLQRAAMTTGQVRVSPLTLVVALQPEVSLRPFAESMACRVPLFCPLRHTTQHPMLTT